MFSSRSNENRSRQVWRECEEQMHQNPIQVLSLHVHRLSCHYTSPANNVASSHHCRVAKAALRIKEDGSIMRKQARHHDNHIRELRGLWHRTRGPNHFLRIPRVWAALAVPFPRTAARD